MKIHIVFDGPPGPTAGRFIETETPDGRGIGIGTWLTREDGTWALEIEVADTEVRQGSADQSEPPPMAVYGTAAQILEEEREARAARMAGEAPDGPPEPSEALRAAAQRRRAYIAPQVKHQTYRERLEATLRDAYREGKAYGIAAAFGHSMATVATEDEVVADMMKGLGQ